MEEFAVDDLGEAGTIRGGGATHFVTPDLIK
jgi:hypothetical protein